jgi:hypothetical protein
MTAVIEESPPSDYASDEYYEADDLPGADPAGESAGQDGPPPPSPDAPHGWTLDRETRQWRPKKRAGRPKVPATAEELSAAAPVERPPDRPPGKPARGQRPPAEEVPMPAGGVIARGVNKLYRRAGKVVRAMDYDVGTAIIECTRRDRLEDGSEDPDDLTVGEAWENLCKVNPRIRRFVLGCLKGGAWGDLLMAHAPIAMAIVMKPAILKLIPFKRLIESMAEPDDDTPEGEGDLPAGMTAEDVGDMSDLAQQFAAKAASKMGVHLSDADLKRAAQQAEAMMGGQGRRVQPKRQSRAQRAGSK